MFKFEVSLTIPIPEVGKYVYCDNILIIFIIIYNNNYNIIDISIKCL